MEDEYFYSQLNKEIERKQNIISALKKILQSYEKKQEKREKRRIFSGKNYPKK